MPKFIEPSEKLSAINSNLKGLKLSGIVVNGGVEIYSLKQTRDDKKMVKDLLLTGEGQGGGVATELTKSRSNSFSRSRSNSGVGIGSCVPQHLLIDLVAILNLHFVDHDFTHLLNRSEDLFEILEVTATMSSVDKLLADIVVTQPRFLQELWASVDENMELSKCVVYQLNFDPYSDMDNDDAPSSCWTWNYFFYSKELKRVCYFTCIGTPSTVSGLKRHLALGTSNGSYSDADDEYAFTEGESTKSPRAGGDSEGDGGDDAASEGW